MYLITNDKYDVVVVGAGHAGAEAALAAARLNKRVLLTTMCLDSIAFMACNPNIGGTAKGHLVREIDALGGEMGIIADSSLLQLKMLNIGKGPAVHSLRGQTDKNLYHQNMKYALEREPNIDLLQTEVVDLIYDGGKITGVVDAFNIKYNAQAVVLCTGVYLNSKIIMGEYIKNIGPSGFMQSTRLTDALIKLGIPVVRFKTGTPARVNKNTIDFSKMERQDGEDDIYSFSVMTKDKVFNNIPCYLTYTNEKTHNIIRENINRAPLYNGSISGVGPRYCPSIEDKITRFKDKERHQIFLEPEGINTDEYYVQGMSTSMPIDVQEKMYHSIKGLENAHIMRYAYAIEYDCIDPTALNSFLMLKNIDGLFTAGQINGSSGYEEAAAQGLIAGINAALYIDNMPPFVLRRDEAYIGVLIDDLVIKGTNEPYRMMTARAEYRLHLRQDNADLRLTDKGYKLGLVKEDRYSLYLDKIKMMDEIKDMLEKNVSYRAYQELFIKAGEPSSEQGYKLKEILRRNNINSIDFRETFTEFKKYDINIFKAVETEIKYEGYLKKQQMEIEQMLKLEDKKLDTGMDYSKVEGLRIEAREKLNKIKPLSLAQAMRISGVNSADITVLMIHLAKVKRNK